MTRQLEAFCIDDEGTELRVFGVLSLSNTEAFVSEVSHEFIRNANRLYLDLNRCFVKNILDRIEEEYEQAVAEEIPQRASLLALYRSLARANRKAKEFYIISNDTKYPLKFAVLKFFDYNLKPEDRLMSTLCS